MNEEEAEYKEDALRLARDTMTGDLRDLILDEIKSSKDALPWRNLPESEQARIIGRVTTVAEQCAAKAVRIIAADGRPSITAIVEKIDVKDQIKVVLKVGKTQDTLMTLGMATGLTIMLVDTQSDAYEGERAPAHVMPDQPGLDLDEDDDGTGGDDGGEPEPPHDPDPDTAPARRGRKPAADKPAAGTRPVRGRKRT